MACVLNDSQELADALLEVVVDDDMVGDEAAVTFLGATEGDPALDVLLGVAPATQPLGLGLDRRRQHEDGNRIGPGGQHLASTLDIDLEDDVAVFGHLRHGRAVEVVENLRPFQEPPGGDVRLEGGAVDEVVGVGRLAPTAGTRRPGAAEPEPVVPVEQLFDDGALPDPTGAEDDDEQGRVEGLGWVRCSGALCSLEQRLALLGSESLEAPTLTDSDGVHQSASLDLAGAGECLEGSQHLHLADRLVGVCPLEQLLQSDTAGLEVVFELGPLTAHGRGLLESCLALLWAEAGWLWHGPLR